MFGILACGWNDFTSALADLLGVNHQMGGRSQ